MSILCEEDSDTMNWNVLMVIFGIVYALWNSSDVVAREAHDDIDFDFDHDTLFRAERGADYSTGVGGPVAARNYTWGPDVRGKSGIRSVTDQCKASDVQLGPGSKFRTETKEKLVLKAIQDGQDSPNDYLLLNIVSCTDDKKCLEACIRDGCNYVLTYRVRKRLNMTYLYNVKEDILMKEENYVKSNGYDSTVVKSSGKNGQEGQNEAQKARRRPVRQGFSISMQCTSCSCPTCPGAANPPIPANVCNFLCNGGLIGLILGLSLGLGLGVGVGAGVGGGATQAGIAHSLAQQAIIQRGLEQTRFDAFRHGFTKTYNNPQLEQQARHNFQNNLQRMDDANKHMQHSDDAIQGVTQFTDMYYGVFVGFFTGARVDGPIQPTKFHPDLASLKLSPLPKMHWDAAAGEILPPIRYQGNCGSCYAFTTADLIASQNAIERRRAKKGTETQELSVQYLIDCGGANASYGCQGGRTAMLVKNLEKADGVPFESCYQYDEKAGQCHKEKSAKCCQRQRVKFSQLIDINGPHEKELMSSILNWGPAIVVVGANEQWMFYNGTGIIKARQCDPKIHNHAVTIVGYNYNDASTSTPYYVIRNSWGDDWGTHGYAKLEAGKNACGVANYVLVTCTGDCRNVTGVKDLINRSNIPEKYVMENRPKMASGHRGTA